MNIYSASTFATRPYQALTPDCLFVDLNIVKIVVQIIPVWLGAKREGGKYKWKSGVFFFFENGNQWYRRPYWSDFDVELLDALCRG